jgi:hypothetical protein
LLNTRQKFVLTAILSQAAAKLNASTSTDLIGAAHVSDIVDALMNLTATAPMISKGELVTRLARVDMRRESVRYPLTSHSVLCPLTSDYGDVPGGGAPDV